MDSNNIEKLRALAFASIPKVARKPIPPHPRRKRASVDDEEGEIVSDDDVTSIEAYPSPLDSNIGSTPSNMLISQEDFHFPATCLEGNKESLDSAVPVAPAPQSGSVAIDSAVHGTSKAKNENGRSANKRPLTVVKEDNKFIRRRHSASNIPRTSRTDLSSKIPSAPPSMFGIRKEADAFLASLNISTATPFLTEGFGSGDRNNSLVIKFSDDDDSDSDSDREHQGQTVSNTLENRKSIGNGTVHQHNAGGRLKSEIDRVKKQIAAFEKIKGKIASSSETRISKSVLTSELTRNLHSKPGKYQASVSPAMIPVELESLRQQIAAKETELQLRKAKQHGSKDHVISAVSNCATEAIDPMEVPNSRLGSPAESDHLNKLGLLQGGVEGLCAGAKSEVKVVVHDTSLSSVKGKEGKSQFQYTIFCKPAVVTNSSVPPKSCGNTELHPSDTGKPFEKINQPNVADKRDTKAIATPKRKRGDDGERSSHDIEGGSAKKKQKQSEFSIHKKVVSANSGDEFSLKSSIGGTSFDAHKKLISSREGDGSFFVNTSDGNQEQPNALLNDIKCIENSLSSLPAAAESEGEMLRDQEDDVATTNGFLDSNLRSISSPGDTKNVEINCDLSNSTCKQNIVSCVTPTQLSNSQERCLKQMEPRKSLENNITANCVDSTNLRIHLSAEESLVDRTAFSDGQKELQMVFIGANNMCSSVPVWAFDGQTQNSNMHVFQGSHDQSVDYGHDTLEQWQEEEDLIDKELEQAQQNRRRCEVRERLVRKQFREAQEALRSANARCDMLYQKREMLAARIKAAELQTYFNKSSLHGQKDIGSFLTFNSPKYSEKTTLRLETPLWSREGGTKMSAPCNQKDHNQEQISSQTDLSQGLELCSTDNFLVSEDRDQQSRIDAQIGKSLSVPAQTKRQTDKSISNLGEQAVVMQGKPTDMDVDNSSVLPVMDERVHITINEPNHHFNILTTDKEKCFTEDSLIVSMIATDCSDKDYHHGFSSASFATDLEKDTSSVHLNNSSPIDGQIVGKQSDLNTSSPSDSLVTPEIVNGHAVVETSNLESLSNMKVIDGSNLESLSNMKVIDEQAAAKQRDLNDSFHSNSAVPSFVVNAHTDLEGANLKDTEAIEVVVSTIVPNHVCHENGLGDMNHKNSCLSEQQQFHKQPSQECPDFAPLHLSPVETYKTADADVYRKSYSIETSFQSTECQKGFPDYSLHGDQCIDLQVDHQAIKSLANMGISTSLGEYWQNGRVENESEKFGSGSYVPSSSLKVLFAHASSKNIFESAVAAWRKQSSSHRTDDLTEFASLKYESPLSVFSSHRDSVSTISRQTIAINPFKVLCKYEHRGKCNNDECIWQHKRDYLSIVSKHLDKNVEDSKCKGVVSAVQKTSFYAVSSDESNENNKLPPLYLNKPCRKWNRFITKVPAYRIGSRIMKRGSFQSCISHLTCKQQLGFEQCFPALHRGIPFDAMWLHDLPLTSQYHGDCSLKFRHLLPKRGPQVGIEAHLSNSLENVESLIEAALELIDFDLLVQKSEAQKNVLYVLSRGLEMEPSSVALWVVYLHLFNRWEKSISEDDLYHLAVKHNSGSYELWMLFINSRQNLSERLEAYERAIIALGSKNEIQGYSVKERSSFLLDLALRRLNCMCVSGLSQDAVRWIEKLKLAVHRDDQGSASVLLSHLMMPELCNLWICCAYLILEAQIPSRMIEKLGCTQQISFDDIWQDVTARRPYSGQAMALMRTAASEGKGCLRLDSIELPVEAESRLAKEVLAVNYVQCAAVCEGLEYSLTVVEKYFNLYLGSVELTVLRARLESHFKGMLAGLNTFEEALSHWPLHQSGKVHLWNQFVGFAVDAKAIDYVKVLLVRCATELYDSESFRSVSKSFLGCSNFPREPNTPSSFHTLEEATGDDPMEVFLFLPSVIRRQHMEVTISGQVFSSQDAVFGFLNLAFFRALEEKYDLANDALHSGLNIAMDTDTMKHCLKELAAFISGSLGHSAVSACSTHEKMLSLFDRCLIETQLLPSIHPLSKGFCESFKKRRVRLFVDNLLGPWPKDFTFLNAILETIYGPSLLPDDNMKDLTDFTERILEVLPNNVRLALSACKTIEAKANSCNSSTKSAMLFWSVSLLVDSLRHSVPEAPISVWVEAGNVLEMLELDSLSETFYQLALLVYPFSSSLWNKLIAVGRKTKKDDSFMKLGLGKGVKLDLEDIMEVTECK